VVQDVVGFGAGRSNLVVLQAPRLFEAAYNVIGRPGYLVLAFGHDPLYFGIVAAGDYGPQPLLGIFAYEACQVARNCLPVLGV
jgi:hypothetical protein